jgi:hypothetical protein
VVIFSKPKGVREQKELGERLLERIVTEVAPLLFVLEDAQKCDNTTMCWPTLCVCVCVCVYVCNTKWEGERRLKTDIHDVITQCT